MDTKIKFSMKPVKSIKPIKRKRETGQTMVEYILLTLVVIGLFSIFLKVPFMQDLLSENSKFTSGLFYSMQFCYRHAIYGEDKETYPPNYNAPKHTSYASSGDTRFFGPADPYP